MAASWGDNYTSGNLHFLRRIENVHLLVEPLPRLAEILDIGCGTGEITASLHQRFGCRTMGIDIAKKMVDRCRAKYSSSGLSFEVSDIFDLPFENNLADLVVSMSVIEWVEDYNKCISEVSRILKQGGQWVVSLPNWQSVFRKLELIKSFFWPGSYLRLQKNRISIEEFKRVASSYGLEAVGSIYHVMPLYYRNIAGVFGPFLGAVCILSLKKHIACNHSFRRDAQ